MKNYEKITLAELEMQLETFLIKDLKNTFLFLVNNLGTVELYLQRRTEELILLCFESDEKTDRIQEMLLQMNPFFTTVDIEKRYVRITYKCKSGFPERVEIQEGNYEFMGRQNESQYLITPHQKTTKQNKIVIYDLHHIFIAGSHRFFPANLAYLSGYLVTTPLLKLFAKESTFFLDLLADYQKRKYLPNRKIEDCYSFHSKKELLESYRIYGKLNIPPQINQYSISYGICLCNVARLLSEKEQRSVFQIKEKEFLQSMEAVTQSVDGITCNFFPPNIEMFLLAKWKHNGMKITMDLLELLEDYIRLKKFYKEPISLKKSSARKIIEEHDRLAISYQLRSAKPVHIPADSLFKTLHLPKKYEWIKTGKRLLQEGIWQKNCVVSYDEKINQDKSAIYSLVEDKTRYTIEIRHSRNRFVCHQFKGPCNTPAPEHLVQELKQVLKRCS